MKSDQLIYAGSISNRIEAYTFVIFDGMAIEKNGVSICDLRHFREEYSLKKDPMIQVHGKGHSEIFTNPKKAFIKFVELVYG